MLLKKDMLYIKNIIKIQVNVFNGKSGQYIPTVGSREGQFPSRLESASK
jgi:hypothetical protein